ncbi:MAG: bifunctional glutamate N-acetyltransferase/amino-acid acetyltransferase ArgJ [Bacillota bacterium]|nr:bifunctional glutamate N-acetyltransferase/amino-acid acetyltransferase ArgJ [Bacillota bacterium]
MNSVNMEKITGGITAVSGIDAAGVKCGIKKNGDSDLALIYSREPAAAAGVFTRNKFKAAPLIVTERHISNPTVSAIVINSGNANACTGDQGIKDALSTAEIVAGKLGLRREDVLVASTGVIGHYLPMERLSLGIDKAVEKLSPKGGEDAARAIMTTDTVIKESACRVQLDGEQGFFTIGGMAKGSGMICPDMATMLAFVATDVKIKKEALQKSLQEAVERSFNVITVDGDTSTNDMVLVISNGTSEIEVEEDGDLWHVFNESLLHVCQDLAYKIVVDGEGATKVIKVTVKGSPDYETGKKLARSILNSPLVKTAFFGEDANWGRIITAMGNADVHFIPDQVDIYLGKMQVTARGKGLVFDESEAKAILMQTEIPVLVDLNMGLEEVISYGCDLSYDYIRINADYRS